MSNFTRAAVYIIAFTAGTAVMCFEILGSRVLAPTFGSSIFVWGSLIGVFMAALSTGYLAGGWLADRRKSASVLAVLLLLPGLMVAGFPLYGFNIGRWIAAMELGPRLGPLTASMALFFIPTVFMGAVTPYCVVLLVGDGRAAHSMGKGVGSLYAISTLGSIVGTLGTAFYLVILSGTRASLVMTGAVLILMSITSIVFIRPVVGYQDE